MEARPSVLDQLKKQNLFEWYYILVMCGYLLTLVTDAMRPGVFAAILLLGVAAELVLRGRVSFRHMIDMLAAAYFIYNLLSVIWLTRNGFPADIYAEEFVSSILPMVFYMVGKSAGQLTEKFYKKYIAALLLIGAAGFLLYVFAPQFYLDYLVKWSYISKADAPTMRIRMHSVIGSTILGFLSVCGMLASSWFVMQKKERLKGAVLFAVCFLLAMLSNQRSAMVAAILVVLYINHLIFFEFRLVSKKYFIGECGLIAAAFLGLCICCFDVVLKIYYRLISLPGAIGQRSEQWVAAVNNMFSSWLGNGLGANGHKALGFEGAHVITDGGLIKIFCEEGIIGSSILIYLLLLIFIKSTGRLKDCYVELGIISVALLQSIGSNILSFQLAAPIFWFAVGRCAFLIQTRTEPTRSQ